MGGRKNPQTPPLFPFSTLGPSLRLLLRLQRLAGRQGGEGGEREERCFRRRRLCVVLLAYLGSCATCPHRTLDHGRKEGRKEERKKADAVGKRGCLGQPAGLDVHVRNIAPTTVIKEKGRGEGGKERCLRLRHGRVTTSCCRRCAGEKKGGGGKRKEPGVPGGFPAQSRPPRGPSPSPDHRRGGGEKGGKETYAASKRIIRRDSFGGLHLTNKGEEKKKKKKREKMNRNPVRSSARRPTRRPACRTVQLGLVRRREEGGEREKGYFTTTTVRVSTTTGRGSDTGTLVDGRKKEKGGRKHNFTSFITRRAATATSRCRRTTRSRRPR